MAINTFETEQNYLEKLIETLQAVDNGTIKVQVTEERDIVYPNNELDILCCQALLIDGKPNWLNIVHLEGYGYEACSLETDEDGRWTKGTITTKIGYAYFG